MAPLGLLPHPGHLQHHHHLPHPGHLHCHHQHEHEHRHHPLATIPICFIFFRSSDIAFISNWLWFSKDSPSYPLTIYPNLSLMKDDGLDSSQNKPDIFSMIRISDNFFSSDFEILIPFLCFQPGPNSLCLFHLLLEVMKHKLLLFVVFMAYASDNYTLYNVHIYIFVYVFTNTEQSFR